MVRAEVGDKMVVPACDVGEIVAIEMLDVGGQETEFYRIKLSDGAKTWIPMGRLMEQGVRPVMTRSQATTALELVGNQEVPEKRATWNRRQRRYQELLLTNTPESVASLLGELAAVKHQKGHLSFAERRMFDQVRQMFVNELQVVMDVDADEAERELSAALP